MFRRAAAPRRLAGPTLETVRLVMARATRDGVLCCEVSGEPVGPMRGWDWSMHHRRFRDDRPDSHSPQNLLLVAGASNTDRIHGLIHRSKAKAMVNGWAITRYGYADPLTIPVLINAGSRWVFLTADGEYVDVTAEVAG